MDAPTARRIRFLRTTQGISTRALADMFKLSPETVRRCLRWETWRGVAEEGPGATAEDWQKAQLPAGAVEASLQRLQGLLAAEREPVPSLEEALKEVPQEQAPALERLRSELAASARLEKELNELAGHSTVAGVRMGTSATFSKSNDGGTQ